MRVAILLLLTSLLSSHPLFPQVQEPPAPAPLTEALERLRAGDSEGAISILEAFRDTGEAPPVALGILGALYTETDQPRLALDVLEPLARSEDADPAVLYNAGRASIAMGNIAGAEIYLLRSLQKAPTSPARRELGFLLGQRGQDSEAFAMLKPWAFENPDDTEARLAAAAIAVRLERVPDAETLLSDIPQDAAGTRLLWGQVLLLKGDPWGALGYLKPLLDDAPPELESDVRRSLAKAYLTVGEASSAIDVLDGHVGGNPSIALQLTSAYYQSGRLEEALETLQPVAETVLAADASTLDSTQVEVALEYGRLLLTGGQHAEAVPYLRLATEKVPDRKQAWQSLGQALAASGDREQAQVALKRFQELSQEQKLPSVNQMKRDMEDPTGSVVRQAMEHFRREEIGEALELLGREAQLAPEDHRPSMTASRILLLTDKLDQALGAAERSVAIAPGNADARYQRGTVLLALRRVEQAEADFRQALDIDPAHTAAMSDLAVLLANSNRDEEARSLLQRVLEIRPDDPVAKRNLARLDERSGGGR